MNNKYIDISSTDISYFDRFLNDEEYATKKNINVEIVGMTPRQYIEECAKIFNSTFDKQIQQIKYDRQTLEYLREELEKGHKFALPFLNYTEERSQEGRHRMYTLGELFGWDKKFPVAIYTFIDEDRAKKEKEEEEKDKVFHLIDKAVKKALQYTYNDLEDFILEFSYNLDQLFYEDDKKFDMIPFDNYLRLKVDGVSYNVPYKEIEIREKDIEDLLDISDLED